MVKDWGLRRQKGKNYRDITLVDSEMMSGKVTFFEDRAESFKFNEFMPIAISNVVVKEFMNQKTFSIYGEPLIMVILKNWDQRETRRAFRPIILFQ